MKKHFAGHPGYFLGVTKRKILPTGPGMFLRQLFRCEIGAWGQVACEVLGSGCGLGRGLWSPPAATG